MSIKFLSDWFIAWESLAFGFLTLWTFVRDDGSRKYADSFMSDNSIAKFFDDTFSWSVSVASKVFGPKIISWYSFLVGLGLSASIFCISYAIALATTPYLRDEWNFSSAIWNQGQGTTELHFSLFTTIALTIFCLMTEFIYVAKSRFLLRLLSYSSNVTKVCVVLVFDVLSTLAVFVTLTPMIIMAFGYLFFFCFHKDLAGIIDVPGTNNLYSYAVPISQSGRSIWPASLQDHFFIASPLYVYRLLIESFWAQLIDHVREGFTMYHTLDFGFSLSKPEPANIANQSRIIFQNSSTISGKIYPSNLSQNVYRGFNIEYLLTTMLVSSFSTLIWTIFCSVVFFLSKSLYTTFNAHRVLFSHIHIHPVHSLICAGACSSIAFLGVFVGLSVLIT